MQIILVRHAKALNRLKAFQRGVDDSARPLTKKGIQKFSRHVEKKVKLFSGADLFITSEYLRARETLDIILLISGKTNTAKVKVLKNITPDDKPGYLLKWLRSCRCKKIVIVSHEPFISSFLAAYLKSEKIPRIKKGSIVFIDTKTLKPQYYHYES